MAGLYDAENKRVLVALNAPAVESNHCCLANSWTPNGPVGDCIHDWSAYHT